MKHVELRQCDLCGYHYLTREMIERIDRPGWICANVPRCDRNIATRKADQEAAKR